MADTTLSQEEINALFNDATPDGGGDSGGSGGGENSLTSDEKDIIGEISNISMGTAATTLFSLLNTKVEISTPVVSESTWEEIVDKYEKPCVLVKIGYTKGLDGSNVLVLREQDVKIITDLMMGGDGTNTDGEISELHLSAISEAMNQMMGSAATSLSTMLSKMVDISPPTSDLINMADSMDGGEIDEFLRDRFVKIEFKLEVGNLIDSTIMQMYPINLAKQMCKDIAGNMESDAASTIEDSAFEEGQAPTPPPAAPAAPVPPPPAPAGSSTAHDGTTAATGSGYGSTAHDGTAAATGQCGTGAVYAVCRRFSDADAVGEHRPDHGCASGGNGRAGAHTQVHSGYPGVFTRYDHRAEQDRRRTNRRLGERQIRCQGRGGRYRGVLWNTYHGNHEVKEKKNGKEHLDL